MGPQAEVMSFDGGGGGHAFTGCTCTCTCDCSGCFCAGASQATGQTSEGTVNSTNLEPGVNMVALEPGR